MHVSIKQARRLKSQQRSQWEAREVLARRPSNITGVICIPFSRHYPDSCSVVLCKCGGTLCFCASTGAPRSSWLASTKTARICSDRAGPPSNVHAVGPVIGPFTPKIQTLGKRPTLVVFAGVRLVGHVCEEIASECVHVLRIRGKNSKTPGVPVGCAIVPL